MIVGGLVPCSFVDYPGKLAAVVFTQGCNLCCGWCHNPDLVAGPTRGAIDQAQVLAHLRRRRGQLAGVVVTGGEPCLQRGLPDFLRRVRELGYAIKLDSNGTRPAELAALIEEGLVDYCAMDLKDVPEDYGGSVGRTVDPSRIRAGMRVLIDSGIAYEFRTTAHAPRHDRARLLRMLDELRGARCWYLQRFRPGRLLDADGDHRPPETALLDAIVAAARERGLQSRWR